MGYEMYAVVWNPGSLDRLPREVISRVIKKVEDICENPFHYLEHYEGEDVYKLRIGDHRALMDVDFTNKVLKVRIVDHRSRVYKRKF